jgi:hypothetical protein
MKSFKKVTVLLVLLFCITQEVFAQSDLHVFGFFQTSLNRFDGGGSAVADIPTAYSPYFGGKSKYTIQEYNYNFVSVATQQLNVFFRKELTNNFTGWVNFEINGNLNTEKKWGSLRLEEAWVNYQLNDAFNVKVGLLIPRYGYLNEIKNRMPLLPYITRPLVYESSYSIINASDYVPERAFLQVSGYIPVGAITLDYAAYAGQAENAYISGVETNYAGNSSVDSVNFKLYGGRLGAKIGDLRFGISATYDKDNQQSTIKEDVPRTRLDLDLGYSAFNFFLEAEGCLVYMDPQNSTSDMDKAFIYGTLGYNFSEALFAYGMYGYLEDKADVKFKNGAQEYTLGFGYRPTESVVIKGGYSNYWAHSTQSLTLNAQLPPMNTAIDIDVKIYQLAVSILF